MSLGALVRLQYYRYVQDIQQASYRCDNKESLVHCSDN